MTVEELIGVLEEYNPNATVLMDSGDIRPSGGGNGISPA